VAFLRVQSQAEVMSDLAALAPVLDQMGGPAACEAVADALVETVLEE
jgi:hypothetical protein